MIRGKHNFFIKRQFFFFEILILPCINFKFFFFFAENEHLDNETKKNQTIPKTYHVNPQ